MRPSCIGQGATRLKGPALVLGALVMVVGLIQPVRAEEMGWSKVFELTGPAASFETVGASAEGWMAAGPEVVVVSRHGRIESTREPDGRF